MAYNHTMPSRSSKPKDHDFATNARRVVEQAIGEKLDGAPLDDPNAGKNPAAVALGKLGGAKGGAARAAALSPAKRRAIAKRAAQARWGKLP
jgi:ribosomal protein S6E (S10)